MTDAQNADSETVIPEPPEGPIHHMFPEQKRIWRQGWIAGYKAALAHNGSYETGEDGAGS